MNLGATSLGLALPLLFASTFVDAPRLGTRTLAQATGPQLSETKIDVHSFKVVESYSGPVSYYRLVEDPDGAYIRAVYRPPLETVTLADVAAGRLPDDVARIAADPDAWLPH